MPDSINQKIVFDKIAQGLKIDANNPHNIEVFKNTTVVVPEPNSKLIEVIKRSEKIKSLIKDEYENIVNGKYKNKYLENGLAFEIPNSESDSWLDEMNLFGVLHNMDIFDIKRTNNRSIEFVISDFYDFEYWSIQKDDDFKNMVIKKINNNANSQQSKGRLKPYVLYIPIEIKYEELKDILSKK